MAPAEAARGESPAATPDIPIERPDIERVLS
jgi:hypothetical protein